MKSHRASLEHSELPPSFLTPRNLKNLQLEALRVKLALRHWDAWVFRDLRSGARPRFATD